MYYLEPAVYPIAGIDSLRMFNDDGCLVGYAFEDGSCVDYSCNNRSRSSILVLSQDNVKCIDEVFNGSKEKTKDKQNNLPEYTDIKREDIHELLIGDLSNKIAADLIFKRDIGRLLHVFKNTSYQYSRNEFENVSIIKVKEYMIHEAYILITLNSFKNEDLETYASILRFFVNVLSDLYIEDYTGETYIHLVRSLSAWLHNSGKPHKFKHIHAKNILAILDQPGVFDKRRKNYESKQEMITNLKNDIAELESELV